MNPYLFAAIILAGATPFLAEWLRHRIVMRRLRREREVVVQREAEMAAEIRDREHGELLDDMPDHIVVSAACLSILKDMRDNGTEPSTDQMDAARFSRSQIEEWKANQ